MAIVWKKDHAGKCYEVRSAGNSLRLYTNGVFHSQWNRANPFGGHLWDLLFLPVFFHSLPRGIRRILVLGVGGGAVINLFHHFFPRCEVVGVDLDVTHLLIAKKYFLEKPDAVVLEHCDAVDYVYNTKGKYDLVVEDLFLGSHLKKNDAVRAVPMDNGWLRALACRLNNRGILVINFEDLNQLRSSLPRSRIKSCGFEAVYVLSNSRYENAIAVCLKRRNDKRTFERQLGESLTAKPGCHVNRLNYSLQKII